MGCGNTRQKLGAYNEKDLFQEAHGGDFKEVKGLKAENKPDVFKNLDKAKLFKEEIILHADESGPVQQWVKQYYINCYILY